MSDEQFTNRHGHTITALQEAVSDLPEPEYKNVPPKPVRHRKRSSFRLSAFQIKLLVIVLAVVLLGPVLVGEYVRGSYNKNIDDAKSSISKLFVSSASNQKSAVTSKSLADVGSQLDTVRDRLCPGGFLDNLAKLYPRAETAYNECAVYRSTVTALTDLVRSASAQMAYFEQLQPLLGGVSKPLEDQFAVLSAQQENWQTFVDGLNQLSVPTSLSSAHTAFVNEAANVRDQWIALVQASNVQDSAAFRTARTQLTERFTAFHSQASGYESAVNDVQNTLTKAVSALK